MRIEKINQRLWRGVSLSILGAAALSLNASAALAQRIGTSTTVEPYLLPSNPKVTTASILTVGDLPAQNNYRMVGIPDGLGAFGNNDGSFTLLMNHELGSTLGAVRAHGSKGAFVSKWKINPTTLEVIKGEDLTQSANDVYTWDLATKQYKQGTAAFQRFCSADLPAKGAFQSGDKGTPDRIFLNGEETNEGRAFAHVATGPHAGEIWQLPRLGRIAFENVVASPYQQQKTVVMLLDDGNASTAPTASNFPSDLYMYVGSKQPNGHPIERAGLTNGKLFGLKVSLADGTVAGGEDNQFALGNATSGFIGTGRFAVQAMGPGGDVSGFTALQLQQEAIDENVFRMQRIEDGAWDPRKSHSNDFYFVTTASFTSNSRLWRLRFDDIERPERGGEIELLLKGDELGHKMFDNMTIDGCGRIVLQEDPGNQDYVARLYVYGIQSGNLIEVAHHNPKFFDPNNSDLTKFITKDEESSGVIDAGKILGTGWFLLDVQAHKASTDPELVEGGQLLAMLIDTDLECAKDDEADD